MSYIGNQLNSVAFLTDQFSGDGSTTTFTLSAAPAGASSILVSVSGVLQDPTTYGVVGTTLTLGGAAPSGTGNISVRYLGIPAAGVVTTAYRTVTEFTATAGQTTFTPPSYDVSYINVFRNGVRLGNADYTATNGTTVVLAIAALAGDLITIERFQISSIVGAIPNVAGAVSSSNIQNSVVLTTPTLASPNITGALSIAGSAGLSGQILTSQGTGVAPSWQTVSTSSVTYLAVAGGGPGANVSGNSRGGGGGGGAGGMITGTTAVAGGVSYTITIGAGGAATASPTTQPPNGANTTIGSLVTAVGGGAGGSNNLTPPGGSGDGQGYAGGSGGGGGGNATIIAGGAGTNGQGYAGGQGTAGGTSYGGGGGGGGAGAVGNNAGTSTAGAGGVGLASSITGSSVYYAGGGGAGGTDATGGASGGNGGGGNGGANGGNGTSGTANRGGGGGAGGCAGGAAGNGGSGIVVISYSNTYKAATCTGTYAQTTSGGNYIYTFTGSGTITF